MLLYTTFSQNPSISRDFAETIEIHELYFMSSSLRKGCEIIRKINFLIILLNPPKNLCTKKNVVLPNLLTLNV